MFGISGTELFIIVVFVLLIFGPDKLPQFGRTVGQFMREFKRAQESMEAVIRAEVYASENKSSPGNMADIDDEDDISEELDGESDEVGETRKESGIEAPKHTSPFDNVAPKRDFKPDSELEPEDEDEDEEDEE